MHELLVRVLEQRDLSKAGELFGISDWDIVSDLQTALAKLKDIFDLKSYASDPNSQSVVEICLARITSAIRETGTIETYAPGLVDMLESCLGNNLVTLHGKTGDTPHAKIASDILSCLFLHYGKKSVMTVAIPVAVKALQKGNRELIRNTSSYLALAAIHNARLLAQHSFPVIQSITNGNYSLVRVLPQVYPENKEPFHAHLSSLILVLQHCDSSENLALLQLCLLIANNKPEILVPHLSKFRTCLSSPSTSTAVLSIFLTFLTSDNTSALGAELSPLKKASEGQNASNLAMIAKIVAAIGKLKKVYAQEAVSYMVLQCYKADSSTLPIFLKEIEGIANLFPETVLPFLSEIQKLAEGSGGSSGSRSAWMRIRALCSTDEVTRKRMRQSSGEKITVIPVNGALPCRESPPTRLGGTKSPARGAWESEVNRGSEQSLASHGAKVTAVTSAQSTPSPAPTAALSVQRKSPTNILNGGPLFVGQTQVGVVKNVGQAPPNGVTGMSKFIVTGKTTAQSGTGTPRSYQKSNLSRPKSRSHGNLISSRRQTPTNATATTGYTRLEAPLTPGVSRGTPSPQNYHGSLSSTGPDTPKSGLTPTIELFAQNGAGANGRQSRNRALANSGPSQVQSAAIMNRNSLVVLSPNGEYQVAQVMNSKGRIRFTHSQNRPGMIPNIPNQGSTADSTGSHVVTTFYPNKSITQRTGSGSTLTVEDQPSFNPNGSLIVGDDAATLNHRTAFGVHEGTLIEIGNHLGPVKKDAQTQSTATLDSRVSEQNLQKSPIRGDAVKQFCEKHKRKIREYIHDLSTKYPVPCQCTVEESGHKQRMRIHFGCQERGDHCLHNETYFPLKTKLAHLWLHLMFLHLQAQSSEVLGQNSEPVKELRRCWECLPSTMTKNRAFSVLVTSMFPGQKEQFQLLKELQGSRYYDLFAYNASRGKWSCFACNRPDKVQNFLEQGPDSPVIEGQLKEKRGRWKFLKRWQTKYFTLSGATLSYKDDILRQASSTENLETPSIDLKSVRSVKSVSRRKGRKTLPRAFEIFTDDDCSYVLKAKDRQNAEEWFQCLQIAVAQVQKDRQVSQL